MILYSISSVTNKQTNNFLCPKKDGQAFRKAELQKSTKEFSYGLDLNQTSSGLDLLCICGGTQLANKVGIQIMLSFMAAKLCCC